MKRRTSFILNTLLILISLLLSTLVFEAGLRIASDAKNIEELKRRKFYGYGRRGGHRSCAWIDSLYPHPTLGFVHKNEPCGIPLNSLNTTGNDFPKDPSGKFVILFLGGSVAQQVSSGYPLFPFRWIQDALNRKYEAPGKKSFYVVSGAVGGWKHPNQVIMLTRYLENADAFVSLEGYNETMAIQSSQRLETPGFPYFIVSSFPDARSFYSDYLFPFKQFVNQTPVLRSSYLLVEIFSRIQGRAADYFVEELESSQISRLFQHPDSIQKEERYQRGSDQYLNHLRAMDGISRAMGKPGVVFFQPIPALFKKLLPGEWSQRVGPNPDYYQFLEKRFTNERFKSLKFKSLLRVYDNTDKFVYEDNIHAKVDLSKGNSPGYEIMAEAIADHLAQLWSLKPHRKTSTP